MAGEDAARTHYIQRKVAALAPDVSAFPYSTPRQQCRAALTRRFSSRSDSSGWVHVPPRPWSRRRSADEAPAESVLVRAKRVRPGCMCRCCVRLEQRTAPTSRAARQPAPEVKAFRRCGLAPGASVCCRGLAAARSGSAVREMFGSQSGLVSRIVQMRRTDLKSRHHAWRLPVPDDRTKFWSSCRESRPAVRRAGLHLPPASVYSRPRSERYTRTRCSVVRPREGRYL